MTVKELRDKLALMPNQDAEVSVIIRGWRQIPLVQEALDGGTRLGVLLHIELVKE